MNLSTSAHLRYSIAVLVTVLLVSACSGSSDSNTDVNGSADGSSAGNSGGTSNDMSTTDEGSTVESGSTGGEAGSIDTDPNTQEPNPVVENPLEENTTLVSFDITVPVYASNALQVRLVWGDKDISANWIVDQSWAISDNFPTNTENQLVVTFSDENGAITVGSAETVLTTGTNATQSFQISADQFVTAQWDNDGDGVSNLDELTAGTNPNGDDVPPPVQASLELVPDKTFRLSWQPSASAQFYRVLENPDGISGFTDISGDLDAATTEFDHRVALYARVNAQYLVQSCNDMGCADSAALIVTGTLDNAIGYIKANNTKAEASFGESVAISADGNTLAVGASGEGLSVRSGAVYVFVRNDGRWQQQAYLKASISGPRDLFGKSISLSANGATLAIGAHGAGSNNEATIDPATSRGVAYVFVRSGELWQEQALLRGSNTELNDYFGEVVALSADGNTMAVGVRRENSAATGINGDQSDNSLSDAGAVYIFVRSSDLWEQQAYLKASNTDARDNFGGYYSSVSLSADGNTLAVGAPNEDSAATGINGDQTDNSASSAGAIYVFVRSDGLWQQQAYIKASNAGVTGFGGSVSLNGDGNTLAVGAFIESSAATGINGNQNDSSASSAGAVYVFARSAELWEQQAYIKASNTRPLARFGWDVSLSTDGNTLAVGARQESSAATGVNGDQGDDSATEAGAAYIFVRNSALWEQQAYLKASNTDASDWFGWSIRVSGDGNTVAVGVKFENSAATGINGDQNDNSADNAGAVYIY